MPTTATRKTTRRATNKAALRQAVAALNAGSPEDYLALFAPDATAARLPRRHRGRRRPLPLPRRDRPHASPTRPSRSTTPSSENDRVATRFTWRASQGPGWALEARGGAIVRFADGQITECWNLPAEIHAVAS